MRLLRLSHLSHLVTVALTLTLTLTLTLISASTHPAYAAGILHPLPHCRIVDQRGITPAVSMMPGVPVSYSAILADNSSQGGVASNCGVPSTATAIFARFVLVGPASVGYLTAWPTGGAENSSSMLNFFRLFDTTIPTYQIPCASEAVVLLGTNGMISLEVYVNNGGKLVVDVQAWID